LPGVAALGAALLATGAVRASGQPTVVFDGSLGSPGAAPTAPLPGGGVDYRIAHDRGQRVDASLFHSFSELGVQAGDAASFTGPDAIDQIFARVTGGDASRIDGLLRSEIGSADLWLLNPAGLLFGREASLAVDGSFHASTADALRFPNGERFEARAGGAVPALAVARPEAFGFLGGDPAPIQVEGSLAVPEGETLSLVGGEIEIAGGALEAPGGRVNLAAVASGGEVVLRDRDAGEPLGVGSVARLAPVTIGPGSRVEVSGDPPGVVFIRGGEVVVERAEVLAVNRGAGAGGRISIASDDSVTVRDEALVEAGTEAEGPGGDIDVAAPSLTIDDARVASTVLPGASGDGGTIEVDVGTLVVRNYRARAFAERYSEPRPAGLSVVTRGSGRGGTIDIKADAVLVTDWAGIAAWSFGAGAGHAGSINLAAGSVKLEEGGWIGADSFDAGGDAGTVDVKADAVHLDGTFEAGDEAALVRAPWNFRFVLASFVSADAFGGASADAGSVDISATSVEMLGGSIISASSLEGPSGGAGRIGITAESLTVAGNPERIEREGPGGPGPRGIYAHNWSADENAAQGSIRIDARTVDVGYGDGILANSFQSPDPAYPQARANAGEIQIEAESVRLHDGGFVAAHSLGSTGDAGVVAISSGSVEITKGSMVGAVASGPGRAGTIQISATESVHLSNEGGERLVLSRVLTEGQPGLTGIFAASVPVAADRDDPASGRSGGSIVVRAPEIAVGEGTIVAATSLGPHDAGDVVLRGTRIAVVDGGLVDSSAIFRGDAGSVTLDASESITVAGRSALGDAASVESVTGGPAAAGTVSLRAPAVRVDEGGRVSTASIPLDGSRPGLPDLFLGGRGGPAGAITVEAERVVVAGGGQIDSSSLTEGRAGDVAIRADDSITISGAGSRVATRAGASGAGGNILLTAPEITISAGGEVAAESAPGLGGVALESFVDEGVIGSAPARATGAGGSIELATESLRMEGGSIQARSTGSAGAGDVRVRAEGEVALTDSTISTEATEGSGGNIAIEASDRLHLVRSAITASVTSGSGGNITISDPQLVLLEEGSRIVAQAVEGSGGNVSLAADVLLVSVDSLISASSALGVQGTVDLRAPDTDLAGELAALPESFLDAVALMKERCAARQGGERAGSFVVTGRHGVPASPDGPLPAFAEAAAPALARTREPRSELVAALLLERAERRPIGLLLGCG
jgi:filamentous hemagglutinin family protein